MGCFWALLIFGSKGGSEKLWTRRYHYFDAKPVKLNTKRKPQGIAGHDAPAPNAGGHRAIYRLNHEEVLPHKRAKFEDSDVL